MTLLDTAPTRPASALPRRLAGRSRWAAGFGPTGDPYLANVDGVGFRTARRRLLRCVELYRDLLATSPAERAAFVTAHQQLEACAPGQAWSTTIPTATGATRFWLLGAEEAAALGARRKG